jgi:hypothetical protein
MGGGSSSCPVEFSFLCHSHKLSHSWLLGACPAPDGASPSHLTCFFTVPGRIPFPQSSVLSAHHTLSSMSLLFLLLITQFHFFPQVGVSLSRELCCSGPEFSVGVPCTAKLPLFAFSQAVWVQVTGSPGALFVSPFNVKWRRSVLGGFAFMVSLKHLTRISL